MWVVPALDPFEDSHFGFRLRPEAATAQQLSFERGEVALRHGVIVCVTDRTHRGHDTSFLTALAKGITRILAATVRVMNDRLWTTLHEGHLQSRENQLGPQVCLHCPPHDPSGIHVHHHCQVQESRPGRNVRDIRHPEPIRTLGVEAPLDQIDGSGSLWIRRGGDHEATQRHPAQPRRPHQPCNALAPDPNTVIVGEFSVDHRRAVGTARTAVDRLDLAREPQVLTGPGAHRPLQPRVVPAPRDLQHSAHDPDRMGGLIRLHEPEERFEVAPSVANQAAA